MRLIPFWVCYGHAFLPAGWVAYSLHADGHGQVSHVATLQAERLEQLHAQATVQFELSNEEHQVKLNNLT